MDTYYQQYIPESFNPNSKVWVYQSSRLFSMHEAFDMEPRLQAFANNWKSHGSLVKGYANLFFGQFIVLMADDSEVGVGGCSIDSSVHLIKEIEQLYNVEMFNRQMLAFIIKDKIELLPFTHLTHAYNNGFIQDDTLYFNNLVNTKQALLTQWLIPVKNSWLMQKLIPSTSTQVTAL